VGAFVWVTVGVGYVEVSFMRKNERIALTRRWVGGGKVWECTCRQRIPVILSKGIISVCAMESGGTHVVYRLDQMILLLRVSPLRGRV